MNCSPKTPGSRNASGRPIRDGSTVTKERESAKTNYPRFVDVCVLPARLARESSVRIDGCSLLAPVTIPHSSIIPTASAGSGQGLCLPVECVGFHQFTEMVALAVGPKELIPKIWRNRSQGTVPLAPRKRAGPCFRLARPTEWTTRRPRNGFGHFVLSIPRQVQAPARAVSPSVTVHGDCPDFRGAKPRCIAIGRCRRENGTVPLARRKGTGLCSRPEAYLPKTSFGREMDQSPTDA
jgi:hypothetical protein